MGFGSGEGSSPSDPPFSQLGGETSGGWRDKIGAFGAGIFNASAPDSMKRGLSGAGEMRAFQKRRDANKRIQGHSVDEANRQSIRDEAASKLDEYR